MIDMEVDVFQAAYGGLTNDEDRSAAFAITTTHWKGLKPPGQQGLLL